MSLKAAGQSQKEAIRARQQRRQRIQRIIFGVASLVSLAVAIYFGWRLFGSKPGQSVPIQGRDHIRLGDPHDPYNSDPPTSGPHAAPVEGGFYNEAPPEENLVHNLEHGYVIIWYNCSSLNEAGCQSLKTQVRGVIDRARPVSLFSNAKKLIAVPRPTMNALLALTSWGRLLKLDKFDEAAMTEFVDMLRNQSPEPNAP